MAVIDGGKKRVCLMEKMRVEGKVLRGINRDADALQLLALLVLTKVFEPGAEALKEGEIRRDWLLQKLEASFGPPEGQQARDRLVYLLNKKLDPALAIRSSDSKREPNVVRLTFDHLWIDVLEIVKEAKQMHNPQSQEKIITLAAQPLLAEMPYPWLAEAPFRKIRATLEDHVLQALARRTDSLAAQMETANSQGQTAKAEGYRAEMIALLDKAAERLGGSDTHPTIPWFRELRTRAAYGSPPTETKRVHALKRPITRFFGRESEKTRLQARLTEGRLVTLTGIGGAGKTRLALETAHLLPGDDWDGIWLVELAGVAEAALVPQTIATALGLDVRGNVTETLIAALQSKRTLLLIDNCEHLLDECAALVETLLQACPTLTVLATSREPLDIDGESLFRLSPLPFPEAVPPDLSDPTAFLLGFDSVCLFLDRAGLSREFTLTADNAPAVASICAGLDGIPLALELAAARIGTLSAEKIAELLTDRFGLLTQGRRKALGRHKTLRGLVDWSFDLLTDDEKHLLCRLSVFAGGWTLEAANSLGSDLAKWSVLDLLTSLVDKSLVTAENDGASRRYRMLETVRHYAQDRLREQGEWAETRYKHRGFFLGLAEEAEPQFCGPDQKHWLDRIGTEIDNLRAALEWRSDEAGLRLACALSRFWSVRGYLLEGSQWLERGASTSEDIPQELRARAWNSIGSLAFAQGDFHESQQWHAQSLALYRQSEDKSGIADALNCLGGAIAHLGDYPAARTLIEESLMQRRQLGEAHGIAESLRNLAMVINYQYEYDTAKAFLEECLALMRHLGDVRGIANALYNLGVIAYYQCDYDTAQSSFEESLKFWRSQGDKHSLAKSLNGLGEVALYQADYGLAHSIYAESLALRREVGDKYGIANSLNGLAEAAVHTGNHSLAHELYQESLALRRQIGDQQSIPHSLYNLGEVARRQGDIDTARRYFLESLGLMRQNNDKYGASSAMESLAAVAVSSGQAADATRLLGAAEALRQAISNPRPYSTQEDYQCQITTLHTFLSEAEFAAAWAEGQSMTWEQAVAFALGEAES